MSNIYDSAYDLEKAIRNSNEYKDLKAAFESVMNDESAKQMFEGFRNSQLELQEKQMQGEEITQDEIEKAQKQFEVVQQHTAISKLMEQEQRLNTVISDISKIISQPLDDLYGQQEN